MDEPFTGLDPVNLVLLREAFLELRDRGRTLIFSTHQMEAAEALCESVAIVDRGRLVAGGRVRDLKRASGRRTVRLAVDGELAPTWLAELPGVDGAPAGPRRARAGAAARRGPGGHPRGGPRRAGHRCSRFEVVEPTLEALFIEHVGHPADEDADAGARSRDGVAVDEWRDLMARSDPLLPNAGIVARREYRDRTRSPLFLASTVLLAILAMMVAVAPIAIRYLDRQTVTRIAVVSARSPSSRSEPSPSPTACSTCRRAVSRIRTWERPYSVEVVGQADRALALLRVRRDRRLPRRRAAAERPGRHHAADVRRTGQRPQPDPERRRRSGSASSTGAPGCRPARRFPSSPPTYQVESMNVATDGGRPLDAQEAASRGFLGIVFVVLLFITIVIYGMWVATGVAAEKSSRVMELMISAASPRQMLTGKVVGIGAAGLTQYLAIALPALVLIMFQDRIAEAILGPDWASGAPLVGLTPNLLLGYGVFFLLGFTLFALIYAAMGSFVSRPDDLQTLSLPLSLVAMAGYLTAIVALGGGGGAWVTIASFLPPFSPFVMLARIMVSAVEPWQVVAVDRAARGGHRVRRGRGDPDVRGRRAAVRAAARVCARSWRRRARPDGRGRAPTGPLERQAG